MACVVECNAGLLCRFQPEEKEDALPTQRCASFFFSLLSSSEAPASGKKKDIWRNVSLNGSFVVVVGNMFFLNVMLPCCMDSNLEKKRRSFANSLSNGARLFFFLSSFFFASTCIGQRKQNKKKDMWRNRESKWLVCYCSCC